MMTGKNLTDCQLQQIVDKTIVYLDKDEDGKISFDEFKQLIAERRPKTTIAVDMSTIWKLLLINSATCFNRNTLFSVNTQ